MKLTELNTYIGNDVRLNCGFELQTCNTAAFCIPEGVTMALDRYTMSTCGLPDMYALNPWACGLQGSGEHIYSM